MTENKKPSITSWIPVYGIYKTFKDLSEHKSSLADIDHPIRYMVSSVYHGVVIAAPLILGLEKLLE